MLHKALSEYLLRVERAILLCSNSYKESLVPLDYRYHCQDEQNLLIFRYDSTPHFPGMENFPYHKHLPEGVLASTKPDIEQVLLEAMGTDGGRISF